MQVLPQLKMLTTYRSADFLFVLIKVLAESLYLIGLKRHADYSNEGHIATMGKIMDLQSKAKKQTFAINNKSLAKSKAFKLSFFVLVVAIHKRHDVVHQGCH